MAKAKKPTESKEPAPAEAPAAKAPKAAAKKPAAKKAAAAKSKPAAAPASPYIDTGLAAQTAARLIGAKMSGTPQASGSGKKETSAFKQLKDSLNKGHSTSVHSVLSNSMSPTSKKSSTPFHGGKQQGHNQTFGSDASKAFVPRRTGGG